jgi:HPt (histidine-containing phosphotransfer) domain-containing protein
VAVTEDPVLDPAAQERLRRLGGPRLLRQMAGLYLEHGPDRVRALREGAASDDAGQVERSAHTLKSSAGNLGALRVQRAAEVLEASAVAGVVDDAAVERLVDEYDRSAAALRSMLEDEVE